MKKISSKKGFSLIELIVVIAVIAAIAAVIVPSISNFNDEARRTSDSRNVQLWNQTYLEARAANAAGMPAVEAAYASGETVPAIHATATVGVGDTDIVFDAPEFTLGAGSVTFAEGTGLAYTPTE
jgi:type IV pilus assembly protein PilA